MNMIKSTFTKPLYDQVLDGFVHAAKLAILFVLAYSGLILYGPY
jgi:hypothetical protein